MAIFGLAALSLSAQAFSLLGPSLNSDATWQTLSLGYNIPGPDSGGPKALGQGYRRNVGTIYYGFDQNFVVFYQSNGMAAVESAFGVMNALTNADKIQLSQFQYNTQQSFDARALGLLDLKSTTLWMVLEQMGLTEPVRYSWTLHDRFLPAGAQCSVDPSVNGEEYLVAQRNLDPVSQVYSPYVNGTLYSFIVFEDCGKTGVFPDAAVAGVDALALPYSVDVDAQTYTPVTEAFDPWAGGLLGGNYYSGLTYDDVGGLSYLYSTNNINFEDPSVGSGAELESTNTQLQLLQTSDLGALLGFAQTNPPAAVLAQFPGLVINNFSTFFTVVSNPIVVSYLTNKPGSPVGALPIFVIKTNGYAFTAQTNYIYSFGNVVIVTQHTNTIAQVQTVTVSQLNGAPAGTGIVTNTALKKIVLTNTVSGDYYLLPPNSCGFNLVKTLLKNNRAGSTTNVITGATNTATGFVSSESIVTYFTNNWYEYYACNFSTSGPALYQGIGKVQFVEADYDSIIGQFFNPVTNFYNLTTIDATNGRPVVQRFMRIITQPDILLDGADLASPNAPQIGELIFTRNMSFALDQQLNGATPASGPGLITDYPTTVSFNTAGNISGVAGNEVNASTPFLNSETPLLQWGSFDNSTNAPIVYPNGSLSNLESQILVQISPPTLPDATNGVAYSQTFTASGGGFQPSFTWTLGADPTTLQQTVLPGGLSLSTSGTISGTPTNNAVGPYDFILQMTDSNGRSVTWNYSINIDQ